MSLNIPEEKILLKEEQKEEPKQHQNDIEITQTNKDNNNKETWVKNQQIKAAKVVEIKQDNNQNNHNNNYCHQLIEEEEELNIESIETKEESKNAEMINQKSNEGKIRKKMKIK